MAGACNQAGAASQLGLWLRHEIECKLPWQEPRVAASRPPRPSALLLGPLLGPPEPHLDRAPRRGGVGVRQQDRGNRVFVDSSVLDWSNGRGGGRAGRRVSGKSSCPPFIPACAVQPPSFDSRHASSGSALPRPALPHARRGSAARVAKLLRKVMGGGAGVGGAAPRRWRQAPHCLVPGRQCKSRGGTACWTRRAESHE